MNLSFALCNRALLNIGMAPITEADRRAKNEGWLTAKEFFLQTMLEALSEVEWTGAKRRRELCPAMMPCKNNTDFAYAYDLPLDCAKGIELDGQEYFEVEANLLFTDAAPARLLYVSNGKRLVDQSVVSGGNSKRAPEWEYFTGGDARRVHRYEAGDNILSAGKGGRLPEILLEEDYPDYRELRLEPGFYLYWENLLSAKYALKLTDKPELSAMYFNKAAAIGRAAEVTSVSHSAGRKKAEDTWQEKLGLG